MVSAIVAARVEKPHHFKVAPLRSGRGKREPYIIGFDSEAEKGRPFLMQFALPGGAVTLLDVDNKARRNDALIKFVTFLYERCTRRDTEYLVFGFNMQYEYTQLFRDLDWQVTSSPEFTVEMPQIGTTLRVLNEKRYSFTIIFERLHRRVRVIDAMAYFAMSLDKASRIITAHGKLPKPAVFEKRYRHTPEFIAYAEQDARLTQSLGERVMEWHGEQDVSTCISAPQFVCKVFRHKYLDAELDPMPEDLEQYGLSSYHGGKNGYYADRPQALQGVYNYDIRSAYPEAMAALPCLLHGGWEYRSGYAPGSVAIYRARIRYTGCGYHPVYNEDGTRHRNRGTARVYITSYELDEMAARRECEIIECDRWEWVAFCKCTTALQRYVQDYYAMKAAAKTEAEKLFAKLALNSLYGKFFQKVPLGRVGEWDLDTLKFTATDPDADYDYRAGGLYHPPIASLITGFVRAKIHRLEHKYRSIMTSTDGFFSLVPPDASDLGTELGKLDVKRGSLRIWGERLYIFKPQDGSADKYALHGFRGKVEALARVPLTRHVHRYRAQQMVTLKLATHAIEGERHEPGEFVERGFALDLKARYSGP